MTTRAVDTEGGALMVTVLEPKTFAEAEQRDMIVGIGEEERSGKMFLITRHTFEKPDMHGDMLPNVIYVVNNIISQADGKIRHSDELHFVGKVGFALTPKYHEAEVYGANIEYEFRGRGLGLMVYRAAINDLVDSGYEVRSDYIRTEDAERVWQSILRDNPDNVQIVLRDVTSKEAALEREQFEGTKYHVRPSYYVASGPVSRRPVHVRDHRRRV